MLVGVLTVGVSRVPKLSFKRERNRAVIESMGFEQGCVRCIICSREHQAKIDLCDV